MNWSQLCPVDPEPLALWIRQGPAPWSVPATADKPQRIFESDYGFPPHLFRPLFAAILPCFGRPVLPTDIMFSRMRPGQSHGMHVDPQRGDWITRVHVPIVTNPGAWVAFEDETETFYGDVRFEDGEEYPAEVQLPKQIHFAAGHAYTFNATARHAFGNDGETDRVHLLFDVVLRGTAEVPGWLK